MRYKLVKDITFDYPSLTASYFIVQDQKQIERFANSLEKIRDIIHFTLDYDDFMKKVLTETAKALNCERASVSIYEDGKWIIRYVHEHPDYFIGKRICEEQYIHAMIAESSLQPIFIETLSSMQHKHCENIGKCLNRSIIVIPLIAEGQVIGIISCNYEWPQQFQPSLIDFVKNIALSISLGLQNIRLYQKIKQELEERKKTESELKYQKDLLEAVIENLPDAFGIYSANGSLIKMNAAARKMYPKQEIVDRIHTAQSTYQFFDMDGNVIPPENLPARRAMRGELVRKQTLLIQRQEQSQFTEVSATPIFDSEGNLFSFACFHRDVSDLIMHQRQIQEHQNQLLSYEKEKNEALLKAMEMKDEFLSLISHEFKTPINVINSIIQLMELICKDELSEKARGCINKIRQNNFRQLRLVNNLLDITRVRAGHIKMSRKNHDIIFVTISIIESIQVYIQQKGLSIRFLSELEQLYIGFDEEKYERILLNLLSNAIKFTPKGGQINVSIALDRDFVCIEIQDEGVGIPEEKIPVIFQRFGQVESSLTRQSEGTGLGLYLVHMLVEALGGSISVSSQVGKGSVFRILLPNETVEDCEMANKMKDFTDDRLVQSIAIEFSDIYLS